MTSSTGGEIQVPDAAADADSTAIARTLAAHIESALLGDQGDVDLDADLLGGGVLDSLGVISLVYFIEEEFGIEIPAEDVTIENFLSVSTIAQYLARRLS